MGGQHPTGSKLPKFSKRNPQPHSYSARTLSRALVANAESPPLNSLSNREREILESKWPTSGTKSRMEREILSYFPIIDKLFFFGAVRKRVTLHFDYETNPQRETGGHLYGDWRTSQRWFEMSHMDGRPNKSIRILMRAESGPFTDRLCGYVNTLAHEMIHAFLSIYTCNCTRNGCYDRANLPKNLGATGHGEAWVRAALAIEAAGKEHFHDDFDMEIHESYDDEDEEMDDAREQVKDKLSPGGLRWICCPDAPLCTVM